MNQTDETIRSYWIDTRLSAYKGFFDHPWAKEFLALTEGTIFDQTACYLCAAWQSTSSAFRLPWLLFESMEGVLLGYGKADEPFYQQLAREFRERILQQSSCTFSPDQKSCITETIEQVTRQAVVARRKCSSGFDKQLAWARFRGVKTFSSGLCALQGLCYISVYHGYEDFLQRCVATTTKDPDYCARNSEELRKTLNKTFGDGLGDACLADRDVHTARLVRNALAHNGGRTDPKIDAREHQLIIVDDIIQIKPDDVRGLFELLKDKVTQLITQALDMPDMHR